MTLTMTHGPLAGDPAPGNYALDGPAHRLFFDDFPRRVRATLADKTVLDTDRGKLLHETGLLPQLYVPEDDVATDLLSATDHTTHCPFKGDASYWTVTVGECVAENAVWAYQDPRPESTWLRGYRAVYWDSMDQWWDEDEPVEGHLRDPYHRVDVRHSRRRVRVLADDRVVADAQAVELLSETGLPNRHYLPAASIPEGVLEPSGTTTVCPYKGTADYWNVRLGDRTLTDAAWSYPEPLSPAGQVAGHVCFDHADLRIEVGEPVPPSPGLA